MGRKKKNLTQRHKEAKAQRKDKKIRSVLGFFHISSYAFHSYAFQLSYPRRRVSIPWIPACAGMTCIGLMVLLFGVGCRSEDASWARIEESGVLKVGLDPTYPPFENIGESGLHGFDIDLANALAAEWGLQTEFVLFGYDGLYDALGTGQVDVLISALVVLPDKMGDFAYSEPYFNAGEILIVRESENEITEMADLNGRFLSVELGSQGHVAATTWERKLNNLTVLPFNTPEEAITAVSDQTADAVLIDTISGHLFLREASGLKRLPEPVTVEPFAMVVRIDDTQLLENLNTSLKQLESSGELDNIRAKWLDQ